MKVSFFNTEYTTFVSCIGTNYTGAAGKMPWNTLDPSAADFSCRAKFFTLAEY